MNRQKLYKTILLFFPIVFPFIYNFLIEGTFEDAVKISVIAELVIFTLFAVVFKRSYCALFCLAGAVQRIANHAGSKLFKKRFEVPSNLDKYLRTMKYFLLVALIIFSISAGRILIETDSPPFLQYSMLFPRLSWIMGIITAFTIIGSLFVNNFFCKYLCVRGAMFGLAGRFSPIAIIRHEEQCVDCKLCSKKCPQNLKVHKMSKVVSPECLNCQSCIAACPKKGALTNNLGSREVPFGVLVAIAVVFYIGITFMVTLFL